MKKVKSIACIAMGLMLVAVYLNSCKKDEKKSDSSTPSCNDGIQNQGETGVDCGGPCAACSMVCTGNGSSSYFPMVYNNRWSYDDYLGDIKLYVTDDSIPINSKLYFEVTDSTGYMWVGGSLLFREDPLTHDVYYCRSSDNTDFLYVPATPSLNQTWVYSDDVRKVSNLNASITTNNCTYTGLLEVSEYYNGDLFEKYYYKKGLGLVQRADPNPFFGDGKTTLTGVSLH